MLVLGFTTLHGMGFACACLSVGKDSAIVSLKHTLHNRQGRLIEYLLLLTPWLESHVETEHSFLLAHILGIDYYDLSSLRFDMDNAFVFGLLLVSGHGSASHCYFHALVFITHLNLE